MGLAAELQRQFPVGKAVQGLFFDDMVLGVDDLQHQVPLWFLQPLDQLAVAGLDFLFVFGQGQRGVESVVQQFQGLVHVLRLAYSYLHNMADAEENLQESLIRFLKTMPRLENERHERAWLLRVAANLSKNRIA